MHTLYTQHPVVIVCFFKISILAKKKRQYFWCFLIKRSYEKLEEKLLSLRHKYKQEIYVELSNERDLLGKFLLLQKGNLNMYWIIRSPQVTQGLNCMLICGFAFRFPPTSQKHTSRWSGDLKCPRCECRNTYGEKTARSSVTPVSWRKLIEKGKRLID